jgi:hypothetical protein
MLKICTACGKSVDEKDGLALADGRFFCQPGGCQTRFLNGVYEQKVKPGLIDQNRNVSSAIQSGVCDVCDAPMHSPEGFLLITRQVVSSPAYWQHYFAFHRGEFSTLGVSTFEAFRANPLLRQTCVNGVAGQRTPWMVCAACIHLFPVDGEKAGAYARQWWQDHTFQPPGCGPASPADVNLGSSMPASPARPLDFLPPAKKKWQFWKK